MAQTTLPTDLRVSGTITCTNFSPPSACITNAAIVADAGIEATKVVHQFPVRHNTATGTAVTASTVPVHIARAAGTIVAVQAFCTVAPTTTDTVTVDVKLGSQSVSYATVLSSTIQFSSSTSDKEVKNGTLSTSSYASGDEFQIVVTVSGTSGQGLCVVVWLRENP